MRKLYLSYLTLLFFSNALSQSNINSPYSFYGLGELGGLDHCVTSGLGNTTITIQDSTLLNFYNPATYSSLGKGQPLFSLGVSTKLSTFSENQDSSFSSITNIQNFALGMSFSKYFGLAFGLKPYARRGYEFSSRTLVDQDSIIYNYSGEGGINEVFIGLSSNILKYKGAVISIGGNLGWLFGNTSNTRKSSLIQSGNTQSAGGISIKSIQVRSFHYEIGISYLQKINENHTFSLFSVIEPFQKINGIYEEGIYYGNNVNNPNDFDTTYFNRTSDGNISNIPSWTLGLNYIIKLKAKKGTAKELNSALAFHTSYQQSNWSRYEDNFNNTFINSFYSNTSKTTFGLEYIPETNFIANKVTTKLYHRMKYRIGIYQINLPYQTNNKQIVDFGTTFGFGIPVVVQNSLSSINLGFTFGKRKGEKNGFREQYYGINIGVLIAPGSDRWFVKRKLN